MIEVLKDGSEKVYYSFEDYRAYVCMGYLSHHHNYTAYSHWHDDLEFICVHSGKMKYRINDQIVTLHEGEGIFVNSRQLHFGYSETKEECEYICILLHPELLCASEQLRREYVQPILQGGETHVLLLPSIQWQLAIMDEMQLILQNRTSPLRIQQGFYRIWSLLWENNVWSGLRNPPDHRLQMVKTMVALIQSRYMDKLTLADIAASANISKNTCLNLFRAYLNDTPGNYLIMYRAKAASVLLRETDRSIGDIALSVGFASSSHFADTFRNIYGVTPKEYRLGKETR